MKKKILFLIVVILLAAGLKVDRVNASKQKENLTEDGYITVSEKFYYDRIIGGVREVIRFKPSAPSTFTTIEGKTFYVD